MTDLAKLAEMFESWAVNDPVRVLITAEESRHVAAALRKYIGPDYVSPAASDHSPKEKP